MSTTELLLYGCVIICHWILTVIQPYTEIVYVLDSLSHRMRYDDWKYIVEMVLRLFNSNKGRKGRKKPVWELLQERIFCCDDISAAVGGYSVALKPLLWTYSYYEAYMLEVVT
ncbi:uncharacterized protein LOC141814618 isoform X2 [Curcuma longa]